MSARQLIVNRLAEILEVDFSWYEECQETWQTQSDSGWITAALRQADECEQIRSSVTDAEVRDALDTVAMLFGWERMEEE